MHLQLMLQKHFFIFFLMVSYFYYIIISILFIYFRIWKFVEFRSDINSSTGSLYASYSFSSVYYLPHSSLCMASSNSELYFIAYLTSADSLWKISLNPSVSAEWLNILVDNAYTKGIAYISQSLLFLMHKYSSSPNADKMIYSVVNFESYTEVWSMYSNWTTTTWNFDFGMPLVSQDRRIYVIHDTNPSQIFFVILDASSGSVQNTPYRSNICSTIFGLYLGEGNGRIYISVIWSINYIVVWDNVLKIFSNFRITSTVNIYSIVYESYTQR